MRSPQQEKNAKQSNPWLNVQWEMPALEWTINISEEYSMFVNLHRFTAAKRADPKEDGEPGNVCWISWGQS